MKDKKDKDIGKSTAVDSSPRRLSFFLLSWDDYKEKRKPMLAYDEVEHRYKPADSEAVKSIDYLVVSQFHFPSIKFTTSSIAQSLSVTSAAIAGVTLKLL